MALKRIFVGVDLALDDRLALATILGPLHPLPGRPVPPENWHITLRFLGPTDPVTLDRVLAALDGADDRPGPFSIRLAGLGAFPRPARATVLWMGVEDESGGLAVLNGLSEAAAQTAGFEPEERPFHAHLTLSRIRPSRDVWTWLEQEPVFPRPVVVDAITVFETRFGGPGAHYDVVDRVPL